MSVPKWSYDVFLCFRGDDTRNNFVSHLHYALRRSHFNVFIDDDLDRGHTLSSALVQAIETSRIAIVVVSPNFASSAWCLDELHNILQCKKSRGQLVRPVFFHVDPSTMRTQTGIFEEIFSKLKKDYKDDSEKVKRWRLALRETAELAGWYIDGNRVEAEVVQKIVEEVSSKLRRSELSIALHPVGLEAHIQAINTSLNTNDDRVHTVAICGAGGIGKTTVAKAVYNRIADRFEGSSFLAGVRETSRQFGLEKLQEALLHDILGDPSIKVGYESVGLKLIRDMLKDKRVLLIVDDIDHWEQVEKLTGGGEWFSTGSKIILTVRNEEILLAQDVEIYKVCPLNGSDALQLFSSNAFEKPYPRSDYDLMPFQFASYARGLPLALIVLGSFLNGKPRQEWVRTLNSLEKVPQGQRGMPKILQVSFDGLEAHEKAIFLDIACFFRGEEISYVTKMLDRCNFYPESGLKILAERSLIYTESNKIWMHDMIQEFGREIVHQESPENPGRRSRLWYHEDVMRVLKENSVSEKASGTDAVEGIKLAMLEPGELFSSSKAIKQMANLRLIIVHDLHISGCPGYLSNSIRWLDMCKDNPSRSTQNPSTARLDLSEPGCALDMLNFRCIRAASRRFVEFKKPSMKFRNLLSNLSMLLGSKGRQTEAHDLLYSANSGIKQFSYEEIRRATNDFSEDRKIGFGCFGIVYHGTLDNGQEVAVKLARRDYTADSSSQDRAFLTEMRMLSQMRHRNLIRLIGFLEEGNDIALIYEYMHNLSLDKYLYTAESSPLMSWSKRLELALEVASGIEFLHCGEHGSVVHGDLKPANILLDLNWTAKVSDFGVARLSTETTDVSNNFPTGTYGYIDPEYFSSPRLTSKSDVYGFGVILLELLSGRRVHYQDEFGIRRHVVDVIHFLSQDAIASILDKSMPEPTPPEMKAVIEMASIAAECVQQESEKRPTMTEVVGRLKGALDLCFPHVDI